ncbi:MAG TPA: PQQ-binding-like beta-propeller repeat protein [Planctomycetota bacterium]|nr:PQQ-binding-like beta-propeller repeat protein [Planctomycetota bacterium]
MGKALGVPIFILSLASAFAGDQPQWGQKHSRNMVSDEKGLPDRFDPKTGENVKWSVALGTQTWSTPIVAGGRVFIGTNNDRPRDPRHKGDRGVLLCLDEKDGSLVWQLVVPKLTADPPDPYLDWPRTGLCSPPTVDGGRVYVMTNRYEVVCLDLHGLANGNDGPFQDEAKHMVPQGAPPLSLGKTDADILWLFDLIAGAGIYPHDGAHASILIHGDFLYLNSSNGLDRTHHKIRCPDAPSLVVIEKATGRLVAGDAERIGHRIVHSTWSAPSLGEVGGRPLVFFGGGNGVCYAFEPLAAAPPQGQVAELKKVWQFDCDPAGPKEDIHRYMGNRKVSASNIKGMPVFHEGRVYVAAGGDIWWGKEEAWLKCIDAAKTGDITQTGELWSYPLKRHSCSTPALWNGLLFIADCGRTLHCLEAATGKPHWTHETKGEIWASPLVADGKVYLGTRRGDFWVLAASKDKQVLASVELGAGGIPGSAVAANGALYVATMNRLFALQKPGQ